MLTPINSRRKTGKRAAKRPGKVGHGNECPHKRKLICISLANGKEVRAIRNLKCPVYAREHGHATHKERGFVHATEPLSGAPGKDDGCAAAQDFARQPPRKTMSATPAMRAQKAEPIPSMEIPEAAVTKVRIAGSRSCSFPR